MPLPLTVSCFSKIQIGFTFLVPAHLGSPGQRAVKRVCVCVVYEFVTNFLLSPTVKKFENRTIVSEVMAKSLVSCFFLTHGVYILKLTHISLSLYAAM